MLTSATPGLLGYSRRADVAGSIDAGTAAQKASLDKISAMRVEDILKDPDLLAFASAGGAAAFKVNCVPVPRLGRGGPAGYPNLNDDDWLWGGTPDAIYTTLKHGIRYTANADTRDSQMPAFGADGILTPEQIDQVASLCRLALGRGGGHGGRWSAGKPIFADNCAACHGEDGKGNREFGAPNLTDAIWLYGATAATRSRPRSCKPAHGRDARLVARLDDATIKQLAVYVHRWAAAKRQCPPPSDADDKAAGG